MSPPVFISYARTTSRQFAEALHRKLGELTFFDTSDIETGEQFPEVLVDALLDAKVVVIFADERYFQRWYCRKELETALKPFEILSTQSGHTPEKQNGSLEGIVLALPPNQPGPVMTRLLHNLPPRIGTANWPMADDTEALATLIRNRVETTQDTIGAALEKLAQRDDVRNALLEESALPSLSDLRSVRHSVLQGMPVSLRKGFVGRANELWTIHTALSGMDGEPEPAVALFAHGGFGKTRLAAEYVQRYGGTHFPGGLFWINADLGEEGLEEQFYAILKVIRPHMPSLKDLRDSGVQDAVASAMVDAVTEASQQGRVLVVVDNVPETQPAPLATWCPAMGVAAVLATSRRNLALSPEGIKEVTVPPLTLPFSVELLTRQLDRRSLSDQDWILIVEWVGRFPLALELLNTTLQAGAMTPPQLLKKAEGTGPTTELDAQAAVLKEVIPQGMLRGVTEALQISYDQLPQEAQKAAHLLAQLAPEPIPEHLLETLDSGLLSPTIRTILRTRSIVMALTGSTVPMFGTIHRVLADFLRSQPGETDKEISILSGALQTIMTQEACSDPNQWALMITCGPHAEKLIAVLQDPAQEQNGPTIVHLGLILGTLHSEQGLYGRAREQEEHALSYAKTILGEEHPDTLRSMNNLALTVSRQGEYARAAALQRTVWERTQPLLGADHPNTLTSMNNLALTLSRLGEYADASVLQRTALERRRVLLGEEHPDTLTSMSNLGSTLSDQGDYARAVALQRTVLERRQRILGKKHPDTLTAMSNLGSTLSDQGDYAEAIALQRTVLERRRVLLGEEHPDTLTSMGNLSLTLSNQGDYAGAVALQRTVLERSQRLLGEEHPSTLTAINNLAVTLSDQGDYAGAVALQRTVVERSQRRRGEEHPNTLTAMNNLALTLSDQGDYAGAVALQRTVVERTQRLLGDDHPNTLTAMGNLALTLSAQGDYAEAVALQHAVLERSQRLLGEEHPSTLTAISNLASTLSRQGDYAGAVALQRTVVERSQRLLGEEHPNTLSAMGNLAETLAQQGEYAEAVAFQGIVVERTHRLFGKENPATSLSAWNYLNFLLKTEDIGTALEVLRQYLLWLLHQGPSTLGSDQQQIRAGVAKLLESAKDS
ncbi:tetratricopeptide repeat protein [Nitrospira sp. T9]|uniref:tetratricopeptide repeat protein n=1 Tax=unclassified Nitrospira TaxID=2652172 RepID=UPI003F9834D3